MGAGEPGNHLVAGAGRPSWEGEAGPRNPRNFLPSGDVSSWGAEGASPALGACGAEESGAACCESGAPLPAATGRCRPAAGAGCLATGGSWIARNAWAGDAAPL